MTKLLITGAGGFIGRALAMQALDAGWNVRGLVRNPEVTRKRLPPAVDLIAGDVRDSQTMAHALAGIDAVVHLVAISYERGDRTFEAIHVGGTRALLQAMALTGVTRVLYLSALGTRPNAASRFHQSRWQAEQAVRASGLEWTIVRPSLVLGPGDYFVSLHLRLLRTLPILPVIGSGRHLLQPIARDDLMLACIRALEQPVAIGQTYDAVGPQRLRLVDLQDLIMRLVSVRHLRLHSPLLFARTIAPLFERIGTPPLLTRDQLVLLNEDNIGDPVPLSHDLGLQLTPPTKALSYLSKIDLHQVRGVRIE